MNNFIEKLGSTIDTAESVATQFKRRGKLGIKKQKENTSFLVGRLSYASC